VNQAFSTKKDSTQRKTNHQRAGCDEVEKLTSILSSRQSKLHKSNMHTTFVLDE